MKIVIIGGTGLIGTKTVARLAARGHDVIAASPNTGINTITGEGLSKALEGAEIVIDLANSPSFEDTDVMEFFQTSGRNLLSAANAAGVRHHIALSVVGTDQLQGSGYFRAKKAQEDLIKASGIPFTIVHSTQFFEFVSGIANAGTVGNDTHLSTAFIQPISSNDVADAMTVFALGEPVNGIVEIAGPDRFRMHELVAKYLRAMQDPRTVIADPKAAYFGVELSENALVPGINPRLGTNRFEDWLGHSIAAQ